MTGGIRATVEVTEPAGCPVVDIAASVDATVDSVSRTACPGDCSDCVTEFAVESDEAPETGLEPVFAHGARRWYRFPHDDDIECPCECLGRLGCPVDRYVADGATLTLVFHAADYDDLQTAVGALREGFSDLDIKRFVRAPTDDHRADSVLVDRSRLTARQLEVLETAYEMGYFERPRQANGREVADALGIDPSTFSEHLAAAERKLLSDVL
ncbi:helix-turn-helix domain-containing protein [Haloglomus halophilum]|uniref:helix-turn-helix domain-containing protein n=1 Tax=Haloglomus halophilum TaxID=2962672 RepID=UPI0020C9450D|nr:helix-turn-helix domain-containing protein [Haloglomus halophilum]